MVFDLENSSYANSSVRKAGISSKPEPEPVSFEDSFQPLRDYFDNNFTEDEAEYLHDELDTSIVKAKRIQRKLNSSERHIVDVIIDELYKFWRKSDERCPYLIVYDYVTVLITSFMCFMHRGRSLEDVVWYWRLHNPELQVLLPNMPSPEHMLSIETVRTVFRLVSTQDLEQFFIQYFGSISDQTREEFLKTLGADGQEIRASSRQGEYSRAKKGGICTSIFDADQRKVVSFEINQSKGTEQNSIVSMLNNIAVNENCIFMADAINTTQNVLTTLNEIGIKYLLSVKENRKVLLNEIKTTIEGSENSHTMTIHDKVSGRVETKTYTIYPAPNSIRTMQNGIFKNVKTIIKYDTLRQRYLTKGTVPPPKATSNTRYFICTEEYSEQTLAQVAHSIGVYWQIEVHHNTLDVVLMQDYLNIQNKEHLSTRIGINKMIYNIISYKRQEQAQRTGKKPRTFRRLMEFNTAPANVLQQLVTYWIAKGNMEISEINPKSLPTDINIEF